MTPQQTPFQPFVLYKVYNLVALIPSISRLSLREKLPFLVSDSLKSLPHSLLHFTVFGDFGLNKVSWSLSL